MTLAPAQSQFVSRLAADTGLSSGVVAAWALAEESGSAAAARQSAGNNDWLNIGYTGSGTFGAGDSVWSNPITAADATAGWLKGQATVPGYGTASAGIRSIVSSAGQTAAAQISAIQRSGWAASGYPSLPAIFASIGGSSPLAGVPAPAAAPSSSGSSSSSSSGAYDGLGGFLLKMVLTLALLGAGLMLAFEGVNGLLRGRPARAVKTAGMVAAA